MISKKDKKAEIGESISDFVAIIFLAALLIIFFVISSLIWITEKQTTEHITSEIIEKNKENLALQSWLQKPVTIEKNNEEQTITIADLVRLSQINPDYQSVLNSEMKNAFPEENKIEINQITPDIDSGLLWQSTEIRTGTHYLLPTNQNEIILVNLRFEND